MDARARWSIVVPTVGRPSLQRLIDTLAAQEAHGLVGDSVAIPVADGSGADAGGTGAGEDGAATTPIAGAPVEVVIVDDRAGDVEPLDVEVPAAVAWRVRVVRGYGRGPAAARNRGWRSARSAAREAPIEWVAFLDDDVEVPSDWMRRLADDLARVSARVGGVQGRIRVPLAADRRPTDWERNTAALESAQWATADMAYRLAALEAVDGFDERFPRAYREDADLAMRVRRAGWVLERGEREIRHPARPADDFVSLRVQAGNADDALMRRLHGPNWRDEGEVGRGAFRAHLVTVGLAALGGLTSAVAISAGVARLAAPSGLAPRSGLGTRSGFAAGRGRFDSAQRPGPGVGGAALAVSAVSGAAWVAATGRFLSRRMAPGPRRGDDAYLAELRRMAITSAAIPVAAVAHRARGELRHRRAEPWRRPPRAVLFDRDGTLVHDVPYNGDPALVEPVADARAAVARAREAGLAVGVITNQSGIGRGLINRDQADAVNAEIDLLVGPFDEWQVCPHAPGDGCDCRKPRAGMVRAAAAKLGVAPEECVVIGDIGADIEAAWSVGARAVLVPTPVTRADEIDAAPEIASTLLEALDRVLGLARRSTELPDHHAAPTDRDHDASGDGAEPSGDERDASGDESRRVAAGRGGMS